MGTFVLAWFLSGVCGLLATMWIHPHGSTRVPFGALMHPLFVPMLSVFAFFLGPCTWLFYFDKRDER